MMNIKNFKLPLDFLSQNKQEEDMYLGIFLKEKDGAVLFIENKRNKLEIAAKETFSYTNGWDNVVEDVDDALYKLETQTKKSPDKAIFFIYSHLIDDSTREIQKPVLHKIKELSKNLELKPLGYIECHEGIASHLEKKDGVPPTYTLVELDASLMSVFVYKGGKIIYRETVKRSTEVIDDLIQVFEKVKHIAMIPTRIILYDSKDSGLHAEKIVSHRWSSELFMQAPKVEVVSEHELLESLTSVFSVQVFTGEEKPSATVTAPVEEEKKESFGFVIGGDVGPREEKQQQPEQPEMLVMERKNNSIAGFTAPLLSFFNKTLATVKGYSRRFKGVPIPVLAVAGLGLIFLALFLIEFNFHKAQVEVFFPGKTIEKVLPINASTDAETSSLKLTEGSAQTPINDSKSTTGKKEIGEKAKGTITIYNSSLSEGKTFSKGTTVSASSRSFILNSDVKVASASGDAADPTPSTAKVEVTAAEIGPEGNISSGTKFSIEGESAVVIAKNESAFTGGVKRSVLTVAKQDVEALRAQAVKKAQSYGDDVVKKSAKGGVRALSALSDVELKNQEFSQDVGDEAGQLTLKSQANIVYYTYKESDLLKLVQNQLKKDLRSGFELPAKTIIYSVGKITTKQGDYVVNFNTKGKEVKSVKEDEVEKVLTGKSADDLKQILKEKFGASGLEFDIDSPLPLLKNRLPFFKKNITFKISYL